MPMERSLYPSDWPAISLRIREAAGWRCAWCHRQCYRPGERCLDRRYVLTVAHIVAVSEGGSHERSNLVAICAPCHLRYDHVGHIARSALTRKRRRIMARMAVGQEAML